MMIVRSPNKQSGFTMLELTTVGMIITILIAIALPNFLEAQIRARVTAATTDIAMLAQALEEYYISYRTYPVNIAKRLEEGGLSGDGQPGERGQALRVLTTPIPFLSRLPKDQFAQIGMDPDLFDYVSFLDLTGGPISMRSLGGHGSCAYLLASIAPDYIPDVKVGQVPPNALGYSPTNGTRSDGDLLLFGP